MSRPAWSRVAARVGVVNLAMLVVAAQGIPFALIPLALLTRRREVVGGPVNSRRSTVAATAVAAAISYALTLTA